MNAGRNLDKLIAELVLKNKSVRWSDYVVEKEGTEAIGGIFRRALVFCPVKDDTTFIVELPHYSTDIRAAWQLLSELATHASVNVYRKRVGGGWVATIGKIKKAAPSAPHAICLAALEANIEVLHLKRLMVMSDVDDSEAT
jgi:hypothetical protein